MAGRRESHLDTAMPMMRPARPPARVPATTHEPPGAGGFLGVPRVGGGIHDGLMAKQAPAAGFLSGDRRPMRGVVEDEFPGLGGGAIGGATGQHGQVSPGIDGRVDLDVDFFVPCAAADECAERVFGLGELTVAGDQLAAGEGSGKPGSQPLSNSRLWDVAAADRLFIRCHQIPQSRGVLGGDGRGRCE